MTVDDLDAAELVELLAGLTADSRLYTHLREQGPSATVPTMADLSPDAYLAGLARHRGQVVHVGGAQ